jgi:hypothetical protein
MEPRAFVPDCLDERGRILHAHAVLLELVLVVHEDAVDCRSDHIEIHIDHMELDHARAVSRRVADAPPREIPGEVDVDAEFSRIVVVVERRGEGSLAWHEEHGVGEGVESHARARDELAPPLIDPPAVVVLPEVDSRHNPVSAPIPLAVAGDDEVPRARQIAREGHGSGHERLGDHS